MPISAKPKPNKEPNSPLILFSVTCDKDSFVKIEIKMDIGIDPTPPQRAKTKNVATIGRHHDFGGFSLK